MRREVGLTQAELAERIGVSRAAVAQWERGYSQPRVVVVERIAEALGVGVGELVSLREVDEGSAETRDDVRWGVPLFAHGAMPLGETLGACVEVPASLLANHPSLLALVMPDDSMSRVFPAGFIVVCDPDIPPANGKIVVASVGGRTLVRRWCQGNDTILLVADSHASYDDVVVSASNPPEVVGTVV